MLHSTFKNCSQRHKAYRSKKLTRSAFFKEDTKEEKQIQKENEITSTVFGPLDFLSAADSYLFWCRVVEFEPLARPSHAELKFWEARKKKTSDRGKGIEPDAHFIYEFPDKTKRHFLIEVKWDSPLSDEQLKKQWEDYLRPEERECCCHIFIAKDTTRAFKEKLDDKVGAMNDLKIVDWPLIRNVLCNIKNTQTPLGKWAGLADNFLERSGIKSAGTTKFSGFKHLTPPELRVTPGQMLFWSPHFFTWLAIPEIIDLQASPLFFRTSEQLVK